MTTGTLYVLDPAGRAGEGTPARLARIAILGAAGYSGQEFVRLAVGHPGLQITTLVSREHAGRPGAELFPGLDGRATKLPEVVSPDALSSLLASGTFDTLVCCLPHGAWAKLASDHPDLAERTPRIVDLSGDHRDGSGGYRYGLPEAFRDALPGAERIANPGCYPTAATLAVLPALERRWIAGPLMITALSGLSGAGRAPAVRTAFVEREGGAALYGVGQEHPHVAEMERTFGRLAVDRAQVAFAPQLVPMSRGILLTAVASLARPVAPDEAHALWSGRYAREPFVRVLPQGEWPETRAVRGSNRCDVAVTTVHDGTQLIATAAIDNLVKGAAGQAIQNLNLSLGWPETRGLPVHGSPW